MIMHIKELVSLARQPRGQDPSAPLLAEPFLVRFQDAAEISDNVEYEVPGVCSVNIDVDENGDLVDIEIR